MKKFLKVLISLVVIAGLAVGAYFLFVKKDHAKMTYDNVYNLTYNIIDEKEHLNIVDNINSTVSEMKNLITLYSMDIDEASVGLQLYLNLNSYYNVVNQHVLANGSFLVDNNISQYANLASTSYGKMVEIYKTAYAYLVDTYYKIEDKSAYVNTVKDYIQNFYNIFQPILAELNSFGYNTGLAYAYGLENTMQKNNFYKLKFQYYVETVNQYYLSESNKTALLTQIYVTKASLGGDFAEEYFANKDIYDQLITQTQNLKVGEIALKIATLQIDDYISQLSTEAERIVAQNYVNYVARG